MRIIAGTLRSRRLKTVEGEGYRPAMGKVRESLFSMLSSRLGSFEGLDVLDLFAGSGSLAFEALSRGASRAWGRSAAAFSSSSISSRVRKVNTLSIRMTSSSAVFSQNW